jgi:hypothetical protein
MLPEKPDRLWKVILLRRVAPPVFLENHHHKADIVAMERGASCADVRTEELD